MSTLAARDVDAPRRTLWAGVDAGRHIAVIVATGVFLAAIHVSYQYLVAPKFGYMKLTYSSPNVAVYAVMIALLLALAAILPVGLTRPADLWLWVVYLFVVVPSLMVSELADTLEAWPQLMLGCVVAATFAVIILAGRIPSGWLTGWIRPLPPHLFWTLIALYTVVTFGLIVATGNLRLSLPGLGDVYAIRRAGGDSTGLMSYLISTQATVVNPLLMTVGIIRRRPIPLVAGLVAELLLYASGGHKSVLFSIPLVLIIGFLYRGGRQLAGATLVWAVAGAVGVAAIIDKLADTIWVTSLFTRRLIDIPGVLTGAWINVFAGQPKAHYAYGFLSAFLPYPYSVTPPFLVSGVYFNQPTTNANANLFASGYANFGWLGIGFEAAALAVLVLLANACAHRVPLIAAAMLLAAPSVSLVNGSVFTSLLSHGVAGVFLVLAFAPASSWTPPTAPDPASMPRRLARHL